MARKVLVSILAGLVASVIGGYIYAYLITLAQPTIYVVGGVVALIAGLVALSYLLRSKWYLLTASGLLGFYPKGQAQCQKMISAEIARSSKVVLIGARGMDLIGEQSPFSKAIETAKHLESIEVFLLSPGGKNARLRSQHLDVERNKYAAECEAVDNYLGYLSIQSHLPIAKFSYSERPLLRLIETDKSVWVAIYRSGTRGRELPIFRLSRSGALYKEIERYTDALRVNAELRQYQVNSLHQQVAQ
jgi:hypothetical protein